MNYEPPESLPNGWILTSLSEVSTHCSGNSKLIKGRLSPEPGEGFLPAFSATGQDVWRDGYEQEGDAIIVSAVGARCGKCFLASGKWSAIANTHVVWPKPEAIDRKFLWYRINDEGFWIRSGSAQPFVVVRKTFERPFALPPLDEQRRIVAEIEKQFTRLEAGVAGLRRVQANLKRYRAAVLKAACEGKLVPTEACLRQAERGRQAELSGSEGRTLPAPRPGVFFVYAIRCDNDSIYIGQTQDLQKRWQEHVAGQAAHWTSQHKPVLIVHYEEHPSREEAVAREKWLKTGFGRKWLKREIAAGRPPAEQVGARQAGYESGAQLLARILTERRQKWTGRGKYKEPVAPDTANLTHLPEGWMWAIVAQLGDIQLGRQRSPKNRSKDFPTKYVRAANITERGLDLSDLLEMEFTPDERERYALRDGDIVLSEASGSASQVGKPAVWRGELPLCCFQNTVIRMRPSVLGARYLLVVFRHFYVNGIFAQVAGGVGINHLGADKFSGIPVPLPPFAEQQRIVAEAERRLSVVEELEAVVAANLQRGTRLRQAILQRAFAGKLVKNQYERTMDEPQDLPLAAESSYSYGDRR